MATQQGITYDTAQEGPFYRVRPHGVASGFAATSGNIESHRDTGQGQQGLSRDTVPQPLTDEAVKGIIKGPDNAIRHAAEAYTKQHLGKPYKPVDNSSSSLAKQGAIGRTFLLAATDHPEYKKAVYEAYKRHMPEHVGEAKDYDQLLQKAYGHLAHETKRQFESLPINMSFHRNGEGNYQDSKEMMRDVHGHRHLYVFQGGDRHDFLHNVHPESGLNDNEMFRAVHDVYGHALHGTTFGPQGEEKAWAAHSGMFSPLAQAAMTAETRGQNSVVNYTPLNARIKAEVAALDETAYDAKRKGRMDLFEAAKAEKKNLLDNHFQFAPQRAVLLPPEMNSGSYAGGIPAYIRHLIQPEGGETAQLTHFSHEPNLTMTDPTRYGTGIKGAEASRLQEPGAVRDRTYFYAGNPERGEVGLGTHKYKAMVDKLYDMGADPLMLRKLAVEANRTPHTSMVNPGLVDQVQAANDYERLIKDYGYNGMINRNLSMPTAAVFNPVPVQRQAQGGPVEHFKKGGKEKSLPLQLPRAQALTTQQMQEIVDRIARQQTGEHVTSGEPGDTKNLAGRSMAEAKRVQGLEYGLTPTGTVTPGAGYEMKKGDINIGLPGDTTISNQILEHINGLPIGSEQQGGPRYGHGHLHKDEPFFWASGQVPAQNFQNKVDELARMTGQDPRVIAHHLAMGRVANNFAQHLADANMRAIHNAMPAKTGLKELDKVIAGGYLRKNPNTGEKEHVTFPEFAGVASGPEALEQMKRNPELRKWFNNRMKSINLTKELGLPSGLDTEWAVTEPALRNLEVSMTGHSVGQMMPGKPLIPGAEHETYSHGIQGRALGAAPELAPVEVAFPDATQYIRQHYRPADFTGTIQKVYPHQIVDEQHLQEMAKYYDMLRKTRGFADGGDVKEPTIDEMQAALALRKPHMAAGGQPKNPFDYENPEHVANVVKIAAQHKLLAPITDVHKHLADILSGGHYKHIEDPNIQNAIRQAGHDAYYVAEKSGKQSHIMNKADGGDVAIQQVGAEEAPNLPTKDFILPHGQHPGQLPVGGIDMQPAVPGQQLWPTQPPGQQPQQGQQQPPQGAQPPQGGPAPQGGAPKPTSLSNILQMTPQGRAMGAMQPQQPAAMARGGSVPSKYEVKPYHDDEGKRVGWSVHEGDYIHDVYPTKAYATNVMKQWIEHDKKKNEPQQAKKGGTIKPVGHGITKEKVTISPNLDAMQYELMSVKHFKKAK